jgi:hypothetical protein
VVKSVFVLEAPSRGARTKKNRDAITALPQGLNIEPKPGSLHESLLDLRPLRRNIIKTNSEPTSWHNCLCFFICSDKYILNIFGLKNGNRISSLVQKQRVQRFVEK